MQSKNQNNPAPQQPNPQRLRNDLGNQGQQNPKQLRDDLVDLYVSRRITAATASIVTRRGNLQARVFGEVLLYGHSQTDTFVVDRIRRVALYGTLFDPRMDQRIGVFSLSGPLNAMSVKPDESSGMFNDLDLQLHYNALSRTLDPAYESEDAIFPAVEQVSARLEWKHVGTIEPPIVHVQIQISFDKVKHPRLNVIGSFTLDPIDLAFRQAGSGKQRPTPHYSLSSNCEPLEPDCLPSMETVTRILPLKFINFSLAPIAEVENICQRQINGVCEVWRRQAALDLEVEGDIEDGTDEQKEVFSECEQFGEDDIAYDLFYIPSPPDVPYLVPSPATTHQIEVYLVDVLLEREGGGVAHDCGTASGYCILALTQAATNDYVLAHELGHILGLEHPGTHAGNPPYPGSPGSVMEVGNPNPSQNSQDNCRILTSDAEGPINPIVETTDTPDCFRLNTSPSPINS